MKITNEVREALEAIRKADPERMLRAAAIVKAARNKKSPLHEYFTWNGKIAAENWLLQEAQELIVAVTITLEDSGEHTVKYRQYVSLGADRIAGGGYRALDDVMSKKEWREELLRTAFAEMQCLERRYNQLQELTPVFAAMRKVREDVEAAPRITKRSPKRRSPTPVATL